MNVTFVPPGSIGMTEPQRTGPLSPSPEEGGIDFAAVLAAMSGTDTERPDAERHRPGLPVDLDTAENQPMAPLEGVEDHFKSVELPLQSHRALGEDVDGAGQAMPVIVPSLPFVPHIGQIDIDVRQPTTDRASHVVTARMGTTEAPAMEQLKYRPVSASKTPLPVTHSERPLSAAQPAPVTLLATDMMAPVGQRASDEVALNGTASNVQAVSDHTVTKGTELIDVNAAQGSVDSRAMVFNEDGFFASSVTTLSTLHDGKAARTVQHPLGRTDLPVQLLATVSASVDDPRAAMSIQSEQTPRPGDVIGPRLNRTRNAAPIRDAQPFVAMSSPASAGETALEDAIDEDGIQPSEQRSELPDEMAASGTAVSVRAIEEGLQVVARIESLDRDERLRLRDRIAALLSRHGLNTHSIDVGGNPTSRPNQRNT